MLVNFVVTRPKEENIEAILRLHDVTKEDLKCSICNKDLSDLKHIGVIFPYGSALVCCDKFECIVACRDELIARKP